MASLPAHTNKALKEWAVVLDAMAETGQIALFRKGGIIETNDRFEVTYPQCLLYPTYLHQTPELLQPAYQDWIAKTEDHRPGPNQVEIRYFATVDHVFETKNIDQLKTLTDTFVWNPEYVEKTWAWEPEKPAYILLLRVYRLAKPQVIHDKPAYGGCISWIELDESLSLDGAQPVLSDADYQAKVKMVKNRLGQSVTTV